jgi:superfamily II RNA helicase
MLRRKVTLRHGNCVIPSNPITTFDYEPDNCQKHAFHAIEQGEDMLLNWPTGVGKTTPAIYAILHTVKKLGKRVVYTAPIKSLSNEKFNDFTKLFSSQGVSVGILTGDNKINPNANCIMATAEILQKSLFRTTKRIENSNYQLDDDFVQSIGCVVADEIHYMNDEERGWVWETTIICLPQTVQLIMLSGTVGNPQTFCNWVNYARKRDMSLIIESKRVVPLTHYLFVNKKSFQYMDENNVYSSQNFNKAESEFKELKKLREKKLHKSFDEKTDIMEMINYLRNNNSFPAIFFAFSCDKCNFYANMVGEELKTSLLTKEEQAKSARYFQQYIGSQKITYENIRDVMEMYDLLQKGIAYHHSTVLQNLRELIEILMKEKLVKILFATETLCIGVNVPAKTCIFTGLYKFTKSGRRFIFTSEYRQMAGRAGRRGMDHFGLVYLLPLRDFPYEAELKGTINGVNPDIRSNFKLNYQFMLQFSQIDGFDVIDFFNKSLKNFENVEQAQQLTKEKQETEKAYTSLIEELGTITLNESQTAIVSKLISFDRTVKDGISLSKPQDKERKAAIAEKDKDSDVKRKYNLIIRQQNLEEKILDLTKKITGYEKYIENMYTGYRKILTEWEYIKPTENRLIQKEDITTKGIVCSQINECNVILLTEMICEKYMTDLTPAEIVAFISIFTDPIQREQYGLDHTEIERLKLNKVSGRITDLEYLIEECENTEAKYLPELDRTNYSICKDYVIMSYEWASGKTVHEMLTYFEQYQTPVESFRKNMVKISNIILTLIGIYNMIKQDIEMIPKLEEANKLILRDIVCVTSLYLR